MICKLQRMEYALVSGEFQATIFRLVKPLGVVHGIVIAVALALTAGPARADVPQCKFANIHPFFLILQTPSRDIANAFNTGAFEALNTGAFDAQEGYWDSDIDAQKHALVDKITHLSPV